MVAIPDWIAAQLPIGWRTETIETRGERMHALVWGPPDGKTLVLVHGNPTWGYLWRKVIAALGTDRFRFVVPDLIGLGFSSKPAMAAHTIANHGAWLGDAIDRLAPGTFAIVAQDWGGPIALHASLARRGRLRGIVLGNTAVSPPAAGFKPTLFHRLAQAPVLSDVLFRGLGFPLGLMHLSQGDRSTIRGVVAKTYRWPLRKLVDRGAPLALARMVPNSQTHASVPALRETEALFASAQVPIALVWGKRDPILGRVINHLERLRPDAKVTRTGAGHFLQEEVPGELAAAITDVAARADWS